MAKDTYNRGGFIAFLFSIIFSLAFFVYIVAIHPGIDLKEVKPKAEIPAQAAADGTTSKTVDVSAIGKPWEANEDMVAHGKKIYGTNCAVCHGPDGLGDGAAGKSLNPPPRNLVEGKWKAGGDSISLYKTLTNGLAGTSMAAFGHLPAVDRWALVQFIQSVTKTKTPDDAVKLEAFAKSAK